MINRGYLSNRIFIDTSTLNDDGYSQLSTKDNQKRSKLALDNYRTVEFTKNPKYLFPFDHVFYDLQAIDEGKGPGMNVDLDTKMTRGNFVVKPAEKLQEKVNFIRYVDFLPPKNIPIDHKKFLVSTSLSIDPQRKFNPVFHRQGIQTNHFNRLTDEFYRDIVHKPNNYRLPAKYIRD